MKKRPHLFALILLISTNMYGQEFRVISLSGNCYKISPPDTHKVALAPGSPLTMNDILWIGEGSIKILNKDKPMILSQKGSYDIRTLYEEDTKTNLSFTSRFWNFVAEGLKHSDSREDMKTYNTANLSIGGGIRGYTTRQCEKEPISVASPISGHHPMTQMYFDWSAPQSPKEILLTDENENQVFWKNEKINQPFHLDLTTIDGLSKGQTIKIIYRFSPCNIEKTVDFTSPDQDLIDQRINSIVGLDANGSDQSWGEAVVLEMMGEVNAAYQVYAYLLSDPMNNNPMQERLYYLFQSRNNPDFLTPNF